MDNYLAQTLNDIVGQSISFDLLLDFIQESYLVKGLFAVSILVMIYTSSKGDDLERQSNVYTTLILVFVSLFLARIMQMTLPFSPRPLHTEGFGLTLANGLNENVLKNDSSFPSDHAIMFMTIASSVLLYCKRAGIVLLAHALLIISLPRLILGFHWPSDIAAGIVIGVVVAVLLHRRISNWLVRSRLSNFQANHPSIFYGLFFAILVETATMYRGSRQILSALAEFARYVS